MNVDQILSELEKQKAAIERAISALKEVSAAGFRGEMAPMRLAAVEQSEVLPRRRGRPPGSKNRKPAGSAAKKKGSAAQGKPRMNYSDDFRRQVVGAVRDGLTFGEAAKKFKTTWYSVREWTNSGRFEPKGEAAAAPARKRGRKPKGTSSSKKASAGRGKQAAKAAATEATAASA